MAQHLQREIERLKRKILTLSALVERSVQGAVRSVSERDMALAHQVIDTDEEIDQMEVEVEEDCLKILALHQPVAIDLRFVIAVLKINNDLERIGDLAVNIAERALFIIAEPSAPMPVDFSSMADKSELMLRRSLDALMNYDSALAHDVATSDDEVDDINREMYRQIQHAIMQSPQKTDFFTNFLSVSRHLERIADYATNIAEDVIYMIDGEIVRHKAETQK